MLLSLYRSFYGSRKTGNIHVISIPKIVVSEDELEDEVSETESPIESESEEEITEGKTEENFIDSEDPDEQEPQRRTDIEFNWKLNQPWVNPPESKFEEKTLQMNRAMTGPLHSFSGPMQFFSLFFNEKLLKHILFQTNLYNTSNSYVTGSKPISSIRMDEIKKVLGIILFMGVEKFPNRRLYWSPVTESKVISSAKLTRNRFEEILRVLHFNDNSLQGNPGDPNYNTLFKLQPIIDHLRDRFSTVVTAETMVAVDEMMIAFKGRHRLKCYMPQKPTKWGYKLWSLAGVSGYVYNFEVVGENGTKGPPAGEQIIEGIGETGCCHAINEGS